MDGGISDSIPYLQAIKAGCDKNIVVLTRPKGYVKTQEPATKLAMKYYHKHPEFAEAIATRAEILHYKNKRRNDNDDQHDTKKLFLLFLFLLLSLFFKVTAVELFNIVLNTHFYCPFYFEVFMYVK